VQRKTPLSAVKRSGKRTKVSTTGPMSNIEKDSRYLKCRDFARLISVSCPEIAKNTAIADLRAFQWLQTAKFGGQISSCPRFPPSRRRWICSAGFSQHFALCAK
jgi:hypothetical protein